MVKQKKNDSIELKIQEQLKRCENFLYAGKPLPVVEIVAFHTFKIQEGDFKDGNLQYTGLVKLNVNVLGNDTCSKFYNMTGTADRNKDGEVELTTPTYLSNSSY